MANKNQRNKTVSKGKSSNNRSKGISSSRQRKSFDSESTADQSQSKLTTTDSWFTNYPLLSVLSSSVPFPYMPGMSLPIGESVVTKTNDSAPLPIKASYKIPGTLAINWVPSFGDTNSADSAINQVGLEMYTRVRSTFSGTITADPQDFPIYIMALSSLYAYITKLKRLYRLAVAWNPNNQAMPNTVLAALGLNGPAIANIRANRTAFCEGINQLVYQSRKFRIPNVFDIFKRHIWLNDYVFCDAPELRCQYYVMNQNYFFRYADLPTENDETIVAAGLKLLPEPTPATADYQNLLQYGIDMLAALTAWDDCFTISGYLLGAYSQADFFVLPELIPGEIQEILYDETVLNQIQNARALDKNVAKAVLTNPTIIQNTNNNLLVSNMNSYQYSTATAEGGYSGIYEQINPVITLRSEAPTAIEIINATRLQTCYTAIMDSTSKTVFGSIYGSTEMVTDLFLSVGDPTVSSVTGSWSIPSLQVMQVDNYAATVINLLEGDTIQNVRAFDYMQAFDWHPQVFRVIRVSKENNIFVSPLFDLHNTTVITFEQLANINYNVILSEFSAYSLS